MLSKCSFPPTPLAKSLFTLFFLLFSFSEHRPIQNRLTNLFLFSAAQETINKLQMTAELKKASLEIQSVKRWGWACLLPIICPVSIRQRPDCARLVFSGFFSLLQPRRSQKQGQRLEEEKVRAGVQRWKQPCTHFSTFSRSWHKPWEGEALPFNEIQLDYWVGCFNYTNGMSSGWREFLLRVAAIQDFLHETQMEPAWRVCRSQE